MFKPRFGKLNASIRELGSIRPAGFPLAVEFGRRYRQVAVFYVRAGALTLVDCQDGSAEDLGRPFGLV